MKKTSNPEHQQLSLALQKQLDAEVEKGLASKNRLNPVLQRLALKKGLTPEMVRLVELQRGDQSQYTLSKDTHNCIQKVKAEAETIYGETWNFYSGALNPPAAHVFETSINFLVDTFQTIDYLEIGSCQGMSLSLIAGLLKHHSRIGRLVSIDPYFTEGYKEGGRGIWKIDRKIPINKTTRNNAYKLYDHLSLKVEHIEELSYVGLRELIREDQYFNLIYIDGSHEGMVPLRDLGLAFELIKPNGIIMLDDHHWPDVKAIKELCDRHCQKIAESWKISAYKVIP
ncbi:MAG: class I SAM-dependent methyltransferase [Endozoicomonadaceae bacterium]|nr:class I SAM-dependent methyltransferase [Endozoicomonadaceae bacterium]